MSDIIKSLVWDVVLGAAIDALFVAVPFLNLPVLRQLIRYMLTTFGDYVYKQLDRYVAFTVIDFQTEHQRAEYEKAVAALSTANSGGTPEELERAKEEFKKSLSALIRLND